MKQNLLLALGAVTIGALTLHAQAPAAAPAPAGASWTLTPAIASQYMFRGVRLGGPSFQPTLEYANGAFTGGVWANAPISDKVVGQSDPEFDFYASYKFEVAKDTLSIQPGVTLYSYPNAKKSNGFYKSSFEPYLAVNWTVSGLTLTPKVYYDMVLKGATLELNAGYSVPLKDAGTELAFAASFGGYKWDAAAENTTPDVKNYGNYWQAGVSLPFQVSKDNKLTLGWAYVKGSDNYFKQGRVAKSLNTAAVGRGVVTVSYAISF